MGWIGAGQVQHGDVVYLRDASSPRDNPLYLSMPVWGTYVAAVGPKSEAARFKILFGIREGKGFFRIKLVECFSPLQWHIEFLQHNVYLYHSATGSVKYDECGGSLQQQFRLDASGESDGVNINYGRAVNILDLYSDSYMLANTNTDASNYIGGRSKKWMECKYIGRQLYMNHHHAWVFERALLNGTCGDQWDCSDE